MVEALYNPESESDILVEKILRFKLSRRIEDSSMLDVILEYCDYNDLDINEIGDILSESKEFKDFLEKELISNSFIKSKKQKREPEIILEDWC